ncbi:unnamed protein product [marine sediment metagenome]|uniref:RNase III domain-containing protein n=1 Tax=marine sediment metagenome TaxID=412755 RepID=X1F666_9ZZZZ
MLKDKNNIPIFKQAFYNAAVGLMDDEELTGGRNRSSSIADCMEAVIGALYLDRGLKYVEKFICRILFKKRIIKRKDHKSLLNQWAMQKQYEIYYKVCKEQGPPHRKIFYIHLYVNKKKVSVNRILCYEYNPEKTTVATFDIKNRLTVYDIYLNKKRVIDLKFDCKWFSKHENGYIVYSECGIFFVNKYGNLIDFQAIAIKQNKSSEKFILLTENSIVYLDSLTLRPKRIFQHDKKIMGLFQTDHPNYTVVIDTNYNFYFIDINGMTMNPIVEREAVIEEVIPRVVSTDSLWYLQVGAFVSYDNAVDMYNRIRQNNIPVFIDSTNLYRIKFGGFQDKISAMEIAKKNDLNGWFVFQKKIEQKGFLKFYLGLEKYSLENGIIKKE